MGIPLAPFLHGSILHLLMNTIPLAILGGFIAIHGRDIFFKTTVIIILAGGGGLWLIGRPAFHVGASGLIFGYFGFLVSRAFVQKSIGSLLVCVVTIFTYGGLMWGVLPVTGHVSWEGHLCGFFAGILAAWLEA
jgi:membrane associated rhomboid family serine protease